MLVKFDRNRLISHFKSIIRRHGESLIDVDKDQLDPAVIEEFSQALIKELEEWEVGLAQGFVTTPDSKYHEREISDTRNLPDLVRWLEYGRQSGYVAARCSKAQEEFWADELKKLLDLQTLDPEPGGEAS